MGGPRAKDEEERREWRRLSKMKSYRRSVLRKKQAALAANQLEFQKSIAILDAHTMSEPISRNAIETPDKERSSRGSLRLSPSSSSPNSTPPDPLDSLEDELNSEYELSDDGSSDTITTCMPDGKDEDEARFLLSTTWNYDAVQEEDNFVKRLCEYYNEIDGFRRMDVSNLKCLLTTKEAELPEAWVAVRIREMVVYQVANLEQLLQRIGFEAWDVMVTFMANAGAINYNRSRTLAHVHQKQVEFLKAGLGSDELEHYLCAFKDWWLAALPGLDVDRV